MSVKFAPPIPRLPNADPIIEHVASLPYWDCRLFLAKRFSAEKYPRFRYKYKALASEAGQPRAHQLRDILVESRLWLSSPRDFNDPFDMTARVVFKPESQEALRERFEQLIAMQGGRTWKQRRELLDKSMARSPADWLASAEQAIPTSLDATGIFSFAGDPRSILMWSHYGDHHTGICLQFEVARDPGRFCAAVRMKYVTDYLVINWAEDIRQQISKTLTHKFEDWAYEREWRIIWPRGAKTYVPFNASSLVGLIFGCRASDTAIEIVQAMLKERAARGLPPVKTYRAQKHGSRYELVIRRLR